MNYMKYYSKALENVSVYNQLIKDTKLLAETYKKHQNDKLLLQEECSNYSKALAAIKAIISKCSEGHIAHVIGLLTYALKTIFDDHDYAVEYQVKESRGQKSLELFLTEEINGEKIISSFDDGIGGGIKSVVGLVLQVYYIIYSKLEPMLFMDEALSNISSQYIPNTLEFLKTLSEKHNFKFILVSHDSRFIDAADVVYEMIEGKSYLRRD